MMSQPVKSGEVELFHMLKTQNVACSCKKKVMVHV